MNQTQANRVVKVLEFFENLDNTEVNLGVVRQDEIEEHPSCDTEVLKEQLQEALFQLEELEDGDIESFEFNSSMSCSVVKDCSTCACFCGWMPSIFPKVFESVIESDDNMTLEYGFPKITPPKSINVEDSRNDIDFYVAFFGLDRDSLDSMISSGSRPYLYRVGYTDRNAVIAFLKDQLVENGYIIEETK